MNQWLRIVTSGLLLGILCLCFSAPPVHAQTPPAAPAATDPSDADPSDFVLQWVKSSTDRYGHPILIVCPGWEKDTNVIVERIVRCLTSTDPLPGNNTGTDGKPLRGMIPEAVDMFFAYTKTLAGTLAMMACTLAIILFGVKMLLGMIEDLKRDAFILLLKIGGILYFVANGSFIYTECVQMISAFLDMIGNAIGMQKMLTLSCPQAALDSAQQRAGADGKISMWLLWDCFFWQMVGVQGASVVTGGMIGVAMMMMTGAFIGKTKGLMLAGGITGMLLYIVLKLIFLIVRIVFVYLMSVIGLGFLMVIGFLFVPLILFENTKGYFDRWTQLCIGYVLTPMAMMTFVGVALLCMDVAIFSSTHSVVGSIIGSKPVNNTVPIDPVRQFQDTGSIQGFTLAQDPSQAPDRNGQVTQQGASGVGLQDDPNKITSQKGDANFRVDVRPLAATPWATQVAGQPDFSTFIKNSFGAFTGAMLTLYILFGVADYIPQLVNDIVIGGYRAGAMAGERAIGEASIKSIASSGMKNLVKPNSVTATQMRAQASALRQADSVGEMR